MLGAYEVEVIIGAYVISSADPRPLEADEFWYNKGNIEGGFGGQTESLSAINVSPRNKKYAWIFDLLEKYLKNVGGKICKFHQYNTYFVKICRNDYRVTDRNQIQILKPLRRRWARSNFGF